MGFAGVPERVVQVSSPYSLGCLANKPLNSYLPFLAEAHFVSNVTMLCNSDLMPLTHYQ